MRNLERGMSRKELNVSLTRYMKMNINDKFDKFKSKINGEFSKYKEKVNQVNEKLKSSFKNNKSPYKYNNNKFH